MHRKGEMMFTKILLLLILVTSPTLFAFSPDLPVKISIEVREDELGCEKAINFNVVVEVSDITGLDLFGKKAVLKLYLPSSVKLISGELEDEIKLTYKRQSFEFSVQPLGNKKAAYQIGAVLACEYLSDLEIPISSVVVYLDENRGIDLSKDVLQKIDEKAWVRELLMAEKNGDNSYTYSLDRLFSKSLNDENDRNWMNGIEDEEWFQYLSHSMPPLEVKESERTIRYLEVIDQLRQMVNDGSLTDDKIQAMVNKMAGTTRYDKLGKIKSSGQTLVADSKNKSPGPMLASDRFVWILGSARFTLVNIYGDTVYYSVSGAKAKLYIKKEGESVWETNANWVDYLEAGANRFGGTYAFSFYSSEYTSSDSFKVVVSCESWFGDRVINDYSETTFSLAVKSIGWLIADSDVNLIFQMDLLDFGGYPLESYKFAYIQDRAYSSRFLVESNNLHPDPVDIYYPVYIAGGNGAYHYGSDKIDLEVYTPSSVLRHEWGHHLYWSAGGEVPYEANKSYARTCTTSSSSWVAYREGWADCFRDWNSLSYGESNTCQNGELYQPDNYHGFVDLADNANDGETAYFSMQNIVSSMNGTENWREYVEQLKSIHPGDSIKINDVCDINGLPTGTGLLLASAFVGQPAHGLTDLFQNAPNPMNPSTTIKYSVGGEPEQKVKLIVYNARGGVVKHLVNGLRTPGDYIVFWDGTNERGAKVASGVYFYRLTANDFSLTKKMVILK